eukprot:7376061-Prymnesium_polylepis.1
MEHAPPLQGRSVKYTRTCKRPNSPMWFVEMTMCRDGSQICRVGCNCVSYNINPRVLYWQFMHTLFFSRAQLSRSLGGRVKYLSSATVVCSILLSHRRTPEHQQRSLINHDARPREPPATDSVWWIQAPPCGPCHLSGASTEICTA